MKFIYEVCDTTDDEMYFHLGIFLSKESAIEAVKKQAENSPNDPITEYDPDEYEKVEVRERKVGMSSGEKVVFTLERKCEYDDETGEQRWLTT